jgi:hypothetical protein
MGAEKRIDDLVEVCGRCLPFSPIFLVKCEVKSFIEMSLRMKMIEV